MKNYHHYIGLIIKNTMFINLPISLYIHIPWCLKKCEYCDFNTYINKEKIPEKKYIQHLLYDLEKDLKFIQQRKINTIFIGGGTPSLFHNQFIKKLIEGVKKRVHISKNTEISIEANPKKIESKRFIHYQNAGINRLSLGIQTFNSRLLEKIGRLYDSNEAIHSTHIAKKIFNNLNIDIMYGLPEQSLIDALSDLNHVISYNPSHISWYQLTLEPNTIFYTKKMDLPNENIILQMFLQGNKLLQKSGYHKYEISSYAKPNYQCQHNLNYWNFGDYIGIGCGAHGKITRSNGEIIRIIKNKQPYDFMNGNYLNSIQTIPLKDIPFEYFMNTFRLYNPVFKKNFRNRTHLEEKHIQNNICKAIEEGYLINKSNYWKTTPKGKMFLNSLLEIFLQ